jgi:putative transposase
MQPAAAVLVLGEYTDHYKTDRPHRTLQQNPPTGCVHPPAQGTGTRVQPRDRLGGLIHEYAQAT